MFKKEFHFSSGCAIINDGDWMKTVKRAIILTMPVLLGYIVMGMAFGVLLNKAGYSALWAFFISLTCYAGSMQFVLLTFLSGGIGYLSAALTTLSVNSRHIFYGISLLEKFKCFGLKKIYMIFSLTDETYSLLCSLPEYKNIDQKKLMFLIAVLDQAYWIAGCTVGNLLGGLISFNTKGLDFSMTALFVVIFIEQWFSFKNHLPAFIGAGSALLCLLLLGADNFLLPAIILSVALLFLLKKYMSKEADA